ncbi:MAG: lipocalin family protein [Deltaproteobacteria bacterium]
MITLKQWCVSMGMLLSMMVSPVNGAKPLETVSHVELDRYLGKWYEIARYDAPFQQGCVASFANYSLNSDGTLKVVNVCRDKTFDGKERKAEGKAWVVDTVSNAKLKVQFFWPFKGDYWIIDLGKDYEYSVVSEPKRKFLWILSRTPHMDERVLEEIKAKLVNLEFDLTQLKNTPQP